MKCLAGHLIIEGKTIEHMGDFYPNQRWASEGEPELGVGVVVETKANRVQIHFPAASYNLRTHIA